MKHFGRGLAAGFLIGCAVFFGAPAFAQGIALAQASGVDITPVANNVITTVVAVLGIAASVVSGFLVKFLFARAKLTDSAAEKLAADRVDDILQRAISYAEIWMKGQVADPGSPFKRVQIDNFFIRTAVQYAVTAMPDLMKMFNLTEARIEAMIRSRLNAAIPTPAADSSAMIPMGGEPAASNTPMADAAAASAPASTDVSVTV